MTLISIRELKELAKKRAIHDPVRKIILASDDQLDQHQFMSLVKLCLRLMSEREDQSLAKKLQPEALTEQWQAAP